MDPYHLLYIQNYIEKIKSFNFDFSNYINYQISMKNIELPYKDNKYMEFVGPGFHYFKDRKFLGESKNDRFYIVEFDDVYKTKFFFNYNYNFEELEDMPFNYVLMSDIIIKKNLENHEYELSTYYLKNNTKKYFKKKIKTYTDFIKFIQTHDILHRYEFAIC